MGHQLALLFADIVNITTAFNINSWRLIYKSILKMALVGKKAYPKATVKKVIKAHSGLNIKKNADISVRTGRRMRRVDRPRSTVTFGLHYPADLPELCPVYGDVRIPSIQSIVRLLLTTGCSLVKEAAIHSKQSGERSLAARSVKKVTRVWALMVMRYGQWLMSFFQRTH